MAAGLAWNVAFPSICYGVFIEYWALFAIGTLVFYRLCRLESKAARRAVDVGLVMMMLGAGFVQWSGLCEGWKGLTPDDGPRTVYAELAVGSAFALLLIGLRRASPWIAQQWWRQPLAALGQITFSLYLIHQFNLVLVMTAARKLLALVPGEEPVLVVWAVQIAIHIALAAVFWYACERPFLGKRTPATSKRQSLAVTA
jgi:peptidoglycan/LPS O-acetylase OafA/YrhL